MDIQSIGYSLFQAVQNRNKLNTMKLNIRKWELIRNYNMPDMVTLTISIDESAVGYTLKFENDNVIVTSFGLNSDTKTFDNLYKLIEYILDNTEQEYLESTLKTEEKIIKDFEKLIDIKESELSTETSNILKDKLSEVYKNINNRKEKIQKRFKNLK